MAINGYNGAAASNKIGVPMSIRVRCSHCGRSITSKDEFAGRRARCPGCRREILISEGSASDLAVDVCDDAFGARSRKPETIARPTGTLGAGNVAPSDAESELLCRLRSPEVAVQVEAVKSVSRLGPEARAFVPILAECLDASLEVRQAAVAALMEIGPAAKETIDKLLKTIVADGVVARTVDVLQLQRVGRLTTVVIPKLCEALADPNEETRCRAAYLLGRLGPLAKSAVPALVEARQQSTGDTAERMGRALGKIDAVAAIKARGPQERFRVACILAAMVGVAATVVGGLVWLVVAVTSSSRGPTTDPGLATQSEFTEVFQYAPPKGWTMDFRSDSEGLLGGRRLRIDLASPSHRSIRAAWLMKRERSTEKEMLEKQERTLLWSDIKPTQLPSLRLGGKEVFVFSVEKNGRVVQFYSFVVPERELHCSISLGGNTEEFFSVKKAFEESLTTCKLVLP